MAGQVGKDASLFWNNSTIQCPLFLFGNFVVKQVETNRWLLPSKLKSKKKKIITIFWIITSWNKFPGKIAQSPISVSSSYTYIILLIWVFYNLILFPRFWKIKPQQAMKILTNNFQWTLWNLILYSKCQDQWRYTNCLKVL